MNQKRVVFKIPKGHMFSKKIIVTSILIVVLVLLFISWEIFSYSHKNIDNAENSNINSNIASQEITALKNKDIPVLANSNQIVKFYNHNYTINQNINLPEGQLVYKDGQLYRVGADGKLHEYNGKLHQGDVVWKNGKPYVVGADGELHPLDSTNNHYLPGQFVSKDGKLYRVGADGKLHEYNGKLHKGDVVWKDGKQYVVGADGELHPLDSTNNHYLPGQFVSKNGKLYRVGADGKLHEYNGKLHKGDVVWKNGKPYVVGADGELHPLDSTNNHYLPGQFVSKDGKLYKVGADGKLHEYNGKLHKGDVVWKNGKPYVVGADGELHPLDSTNNHYLPGQFVSKDGKLYKVGADGKLHEYNGKLHKGDVVWKNGKPYIVGADGKLHKLKDGQIFKGSDGKPYIYKNGKIVPLSSQGATAGDLVKIGNKMYKIGKDGKLSEYTGKPKIGNNVWSDGKLHYVGADGKLHNLKEGQILLGKNGQLYTVKNGQLVPYKKSCFTQLINGQWFISDKEGKLHPFEDGQECSNQDNIIKLKGNRIIKIPNTKNALKENTANFESGDLNQQWLDYMSNVDPKALTAPIKGDKPQQQESKDTPKEFLDPESKGFKIPTPRQSNAYAAQNGQDDKIAFMKHAKETDNSDLKNSGSMNPYPYSLAVGSIIPATLITGINSDLPGEIIAQVSKNIYDSKTGRYLLIPQGTKLIGVYSSKVTYGQERILMAWNRLEFPNGLRYNLEGMPGADLLGYSGISDKVDNHYFKLFSSALLFSIFGAVSQLTQPNQGSNVTTPTSIVYSAIGQQMTQVASSQVEKNMDVQPTIKVTPGDNFNVLASRTLVFGSPYKYI